MRGGEAIGGGVVFVTLAIAGCGGSAGDRASTVVRHSSAQAQEREYVDEAVQSARRVKGARAWVRLKATAVAVGSRLSRQTRRYVRSWLLFTSLQSQLTVLPRAMVGWGHRREFGRFIRLAATVHGVVYYIIPTASPFIGTTAVPRCVRTLVAEVHAEAERIPVSLWAQTLALAAREAVSDLEVLKRETGDGV